MIDYRHKPLKRNVEGICDDDGEQFRMDKLKANLLVSRVTGSCITSGVLATLKRTFQETCDDEEQESLKKGRRKIEK